MNYEIGEVCGRDGCDGVIEEKPVENCSCHINPPCSACTTPAEFCPVCDWAAVDDEKPFNDFLVTYKPSSNNFKSWRRRPLDPTKIDYMIDSHTNSSQICEGVYPEGTTKEQVIQRVKGTFGGRFEYFGGGKFKYIAYTD